MKKKAKKVTKKSAKKKAAKKSIQKRVILTAEAPQPIGPYSQAIQSGPFLFCSGQIPLDPITGQVVSGDVQAPMHDVLTAPLKAIRMNAAADGTDHKQHAVAPAGAVGKYNPSHVPTGI